MNRGQFSKKWEDLEFSDNFIFCKVMQDEELCRELLEILLGFKIEKIEYIKTENQLENFYDSKGVRLDVYVKDSNRVFDIEMQTGNYTDLIMRSRYYQSASDVATTKRRTQFNKLKETYILFVCKNDPFGFGMPRYTKESRFKEIDKFVYDDKTHHLFYNCSAWQKEDDEGIREVMKFIFSLKADSNFTQKLETATDYAKANSVLKDEYMYLEDVIEEEKEFAREEGHAEGHAKGLAEGRAEGLSEGLAEGREKGLEEGKEETTKALLKEGIPNETIARCVGIPLERVLEIKNSNP